MSTTRIAVALLLASMLAGCGNFFGGPAQTETDTDSVQRAEDPYHTDPKYNLPPSESDYNPKTQEGAESGFSMVKSLFGLGAKKEGGGGGPAGVGVNSYLWRATLDTVSFMPLASADPFGGVIITDWYSPAQTPNERFKVNVFILGRELRADGVRCTVFRQTRNAEGQWADAPVDQKTGTDIENAILTRARQMRLSTASTQ
jgi:Domain of unknown function (DUF3576)